MLESIFGGGGGSAPPPIPSAPLDEAAFAPIPLSDVDFETAQQRFGGIRQLDPIAGARTFMTPMEAAALGKLQSTAEGFDLVADRVAKQQAAQAQAQVASQIASAQRGGFDPNLIRMGVQQGMQARQNIANQAAIAGAQERLAAQQAFANAVRQQAQTNLGFRQATIAGQAIDAQREAALLEAKRRYMAQGFSEQEANRQAQMALAFGQQKQELTEGQMQFQQAQAEREREMRESQQRQQGMLSMGQALGGFLASQRGKKSIPGAPTGETSAAGSAASAV
jgi:hypothetical protein